MGKIVDKATTNAWAKTQDAKACRYVAARAALRAFPAVFLVRKAPYEDNQDEFDLRAAVTLPTLFGLSLSAASAAPDASGNSASADTDIIISALDHWSGQTAMGFDPATAEGDEAATQAIMSAMSTTPYFGSGGTRYVGSTIQDAARAMSTAAKMAALKNGATSEAAAARAEDVFALAFASASWDAEDDAKNWGPLWPTGAVSVSEMLKLWDRYKVFLGQAPEVWGFWIEWYDSLLTGQPLNWPAIRDIPLNIGGAEWDPIQGAAVTAARITNILGAQPSQ